MYIEGIRFQSDLEAARYLELKELEKAGHIEDLQLQVKFELIPKQKTEDGQTLRSTSYYADFVYFDKLKKKQVIEDTKGIKTPDYVIKFKLMLYLKKLHITEIKQAPWGKECLKRFKLNLHLNKKSSRSK